MIADAAKRRNQDAIRGLLATVGAPRGAIR